MRQATQNEKAASRKAQKAKTPATVKAKKGKPIKCKITTAAEKTIPIRAANNLGPPVS